MAGIVTFHFDGGEPLWLEKAFRILEKHGCPGGLALTAETDGAVLAQAGKMRDAGWEIICRPKADAYDNAERSEMPGSAERSEMPGSAERSEMSGSAERSEMPGSAERSEMPGSAERSEMSENAERSEMPGSAERSEMSENAERSGEKGSACRADAPETDGAAENAERELFACRQLLIGKGFDVRGFLAPGGTLSPTIRTAAAKVFDEAFQDVSDVPPEKALNRCGRKPVNRYDLRRVCADGLNYAKLCALTDAAVENDGWLILYTRCPSLRDAGGDTDGNAGGVSCGNADGGTDGTPDGNADFAADRLDRLLSYIREKGADVKTAAQVLDGEKTLTKIVCEGYDGEECFVHARMAADGKGTLLITAQKLNTAGSDCFDRLNVKLSRDGGRTWTDFLPDDGFAPTYEDGIRSVCCDMTPLYHKKTGKFLVTGHIAQYRGDGIFPIETASRRRVTPYAVFDPEKERFTPFRVVKMPDQVKYSDCGSGCSQCLELPCGDLLVPISFAETVGGVKQNAKAAVMRCSFDGETLAVREIGAPVEVKDEVRGIGESSVIFADGKYLHTIRGDTHGYVSESRDGLTYTDPVLWRWDDGEIVPTYNTQSHFLTCGGKLFLVYTRKAGNNDHVFRHRAPLFVSEVDTGTLRLVRDTEFIAVPERGARLGNFGVCNLNAHEAMIVVSEWMQPKGCEAYGSDNALWVTEIRM